MSAGHEPDGQGFRSPRGSRDHATRAGAGRTSDTWTSRSAWRRPRWTAITWMEPKALCRVAWTRARWSPALVRRAYDHVTIGGRPRAATPYVCSRVGGP